MRGFLLSRGIPRGAVRRGADVALCRQLGNCLHRAAACGFCDCSSDSSSSRPSGPLGFYRRMIKEGKLRYDNHQEKVASELEDLLVRLEKYDNEMQDYHAKLAMWENNRETERRKLLMKEAKEKQKDGEHNAGLVDKWLSRKRNQNVEPGVGRMVSYLNREKKLDSYVGRRPVPPPAPKGLYLYGNVGSGKTMLMDMFYSATEGVVKHRRRFHFHEAMIGIHEHMHEVWKKHREEKPFQSGIFSWIDSLPFDRRVKEWLVGEERYKEEAKMEHILPAVADRFLLDDRRAERTGASILCFDEIQTVDVFAVVALSGIVSRLLSNGTVLVATSNRPPEDLNQDGMQLDIFLKFVSEMEDNCKKLLIGSEIDYRRCLADGISDDALFFWPLNEDTRRRVENIWQEMTSQSGGKIVSATIPVMFGRRMEIPESCQGIARFTFEHLCGRPVGAADYIAIAKRYHTVFISDIPVMSMRIRDKVKHRSIEIPPCSSSKDKVPRRSSFQARRFITLVDELYNHHCRLVCSANSSIEDLFQGSDEGTLFDLESFQFETEAEGGRLRQNVMAAGGVGLGGAPAAIVSLLSGQEEMFAFRRAISRLIEMQTPLYLTRAELVHPQLGVIVNSDGHAPGQSIFR